MKKHLFKFAVLILLSCSTLFSCSLDENGSYDGLQVDNQKTVIKLDVDVAQKEFAKILSKAVSNNIEARKFIKDEALKQFDNDYDVFYPFVKDKEIKSGQTFRKLLLSYTSSERLEQIEKSLPLLTIYVPDLSLFVNVNARNWDINDKDVPVAISNEKVGSILYLNGDSIMTLERNEIPGYQLLLVKNNERVRVGPQSFATRNNTEQLSYEFIDDVFNGSIASGKPIQTRAENFPYQDDEYLSKSMLSPVVIQAWETMKGNPSLQRDYIYYGLTPTHQEGELNKTIDECLYRFEIDPNAYFKIADQTADPKIKTNESTINKKAELRREEIIRRLWTDGNFEIRFRFFTGVKSSTALDYFELTFNPTPNDLFNINIKTDRKHSTWFRHTKFTYTIDPTQLGRKWYYPMRNGKNSRLPKWDLSQHSLERYVSIFEIDESETYKETKTYITTHSTNFKSSAEGSYNINKFGIKLGLGYDAGNVVTNTSSVEIITNKGDDYFGNLILYFYDSIIVREDATKGYKLKDICNGTVTVTMLPIPD